jgi:DNA (cytosine-5)-methyltransferase 1
MQQNSLASKTLKVVDLFCGCGGLSSGFQNAGFEILAAYDAWDTAIQCYKENFHHPASCLDLSDVSKAINEINQWKCDIIIGGPPCQDFSHAGKRQEGARANLTTSFAKIVTSIRPTWFVMENVDRALGSVSYAQAKDIFQQAGYGISEVVLDASLCGVPQKRKRLFCIGKLEEENAFMVERIQKGMRKKPMTVREYLGEELAVEHYYRHPRNYNRRGVFSVDEPSPTIRGVNRPIPLGYPGHSQDSISITSSVRPLTSLERARIQTFPVDYKWIGSKTERETMIGNAVPVKLAEFVAKAILASNANQTEIRPWSRETSSVKAACVQGMSKPQHFEQLIFRI